MKVWLRTFGCRANQADSEVMRRMIEADGGELVASPAAADVAVFNSCTVTGHAEAELRRSIRRVARRHPHIRSIVTGCAAAVSPDRGREHSLHDLPTVDRVIAGADFPAIAAALELSPRSVATPPRAQTGTRALLRVQDGCDEHCTFCATTVARGASRSRSMGAVIAEARALAAWHAEIVLTGIHLGSYGRDIGASLGALVERLCQDVPDVRFRLSSIEATEVDARLASLFRDAPQHLAPHLHAPLQSGSDRVLRRMGRHWYTARTYEDAIARVTGGREVFALGADVIAGFPGETEVDHTATCSLLERLPVTYLHVFPYSPRPGTPARRLPGKLEQATIAQRAADLREIGARATRRYEAARSGELAEVIVLGGDGTPSGLTEDYLTVALDRSDLPRGTRARVRLEMIGEDLGAAVIPNERA